MLAELEREEREMENGNSIDDYISSSEMYESEDSAMEQQLFDHRRPRNSVAGGIRYGEERKF